MILLISASQVARITGMGQLAPGCLTSFHSDLRYKAMHHTQILFKDGKEGTRRGFFFFNPELTIHLLCTKNVSSSRLWLVLIFFFLVEHWTAGIYAHTT
jgi:hypothetical protein